MAEERECETLGHKQDAEEQPCPYRSEIGDDQTPCACCDDCRVLCADEI